MQVMGWISILTGLLYFRKVAGILLIIIGITVVYVAWKSKKNENELTHREFQAKINMTRRFKKAQKVAKEQSKRDFLIKDLSKLPNLESKAKKHKNQIGSFIRNSRCYR